MNANKNEVLKLDNQICFSLYVCSKEIIKKYKPILEPLKLTYTGYIAMLALWEKDNIKVKELGEKLFLDSGTLTPLLKKLENTGYVKRIRDERDERNVYIKLTDEGRSLKEKAAGIPHQLLCSIYKNESIDTKEAGALLGVLHSLMDTLKE